ncbi:MAG: TonB-dependent receptor plug domain-containing protein [Maribacter sp.]
MKTRILILNCFILLSFSVVRAQRSTVKMVMVHGVATDSIGFPVKKGIVFADSLKTGVRTNNKGKYKLRIPSKTKFISMYSPDYGVQNLPYDGEEEINFTFPKGTKKITKQELSKLGYIFDVEVFRNIGKKSYSEYLSIFQIINEKFSGVVVRGSQVYVRGVITLGGSQIPLFIVDGNYVDDISNINPVELKSIELLKGEETALYGSRGAAGVFIISLK